LNPVVSAVTAVSKIKAVDMAQKKYCNLVRYFKLDRLSIFWEPKIIFRCGNNLLIILDLDRHPININYNRYITTYTKFKSSIPMRQKNK
jgi:hypothetical protein